MHFLIDAFFAAPESGLPLLLTARASQVACSHFFMNDVLAAPASALPFLSTALAAQVLDAEAGAWAWADSMHIEPMIATSSFFMSIPQSM
ncbi:MAG: hypothetical protein ACTHJ1_15800 [Bordetella sp.]|uniref:hypothetical protein n=1 Tax=Bordetella sp. TaxID=28081 RepID=UPI003F7C5B23